MDLERELNEITTPVEGTLILTPDNSLRKEVSETLTRFFSSAAEFEPDPNSPGLQGLKYLRLPITFLESNKGQVPASRYGETFVPRYTGWEVKAQAHTCQKEACLWPWAHNPHRRTSPQGELCAEAERGEKGYQISRIYGKQTNSLKNILKLVFYYPASLKTLFPQYSFKENKIQAPITEYRLTKYFFNWKNMVNMPLFILIFKSLHGNQATTTERGLKETSTLLPSLMFTEKQMWDCTQFTNNLLKNSLQIYGFFPLFKSGGGSKGNGQTVPCALAKCRNRTCLTKERCLERLVRHAKCMIMSVRKRDINTVFSSFSAGSSSSVSVLILPASERRVHRWSNTKKKTPWLIFFQKQILLFPCKWIL